MFLDIGLGIIYAILTSKIFDLELSNSLLIGGVIFSVLVDLDFIFYLFSKKNLDEKSHNHRNIFHYPILYIFLGIVIASFFGKEWIFLFVICSISHFINDTVGIGWGVKWLYPFNSNSYKIGVISYKAPGKERLPKKFLYSWNDEEVKEVADRYGDPNWFKNIYLNGHIYAIFELFVLGISFLLLYLVK